MRFPVIKKYIGFIILLSLIGGFVYAFNVNGKLFWDDDDWIVNNIFVHDFSHLKEIFSKNILAGFGLNSNYYRPLLSISFAFNYIIHGTNPAGYHILSDLFHIGNGILIFILLLYVFKNWVPAFITSVLFLIHPLQVEAVAYISGRGDPMSVFFILLSLLLFINYNDEKQGKVKWLIGALMFMVLAVLSRETAVLIPIFLLVFYIAFLSEEKFLQSLKKGIFKTLPFFGVSLVYGLLRLTVLNFQNTLNFYAQANDYSSHLAYRLFTFGHVLLEYLKLIFVPLGLHMERDFPVSTSLFQWPVWLAFILLLGLAGFVIWLYRKEGKDNPNFRIWFFSTAWFFTGLSMVSGIVPVNAIIYEHWLYFPLIGFFTLCGYYLWLLLNYLKEKKLDFVFNAVVFVFVAYCIFFGFISIKRNIIWGKPAEFYEEILRYNPGSIRILNNLGNLYSDSGRLEDAAKMYQRIIDDKNNFYAQPYYNLGNIYRDTGNIDKAVELYKQAIQKDPSFPFSYQNLSAIYANQGKWADAKVMIENYIKIKPEDPVAYYNLALVYKQLGDKESALKNLNQGLSLVNSDSQIGQAIEQLLNTLK